ncbi:ABC transporter permease [Conexibacter sp. W3-3-2]|uniref:ABC transporter permease n=1 Tax=Conexibacter sp. W3-3-2 TaxID=2675227 RepID=UPI0012B74E19|nr:ABC transporter permease [Conexibacter sp. W3-3-2]MTD44498.1 ABC transporter permease [Conexibacter sp. W3-3-2]
MTSLRSIARAMFLGFVRDRSALFFSIAFPLLLLVLLGGLAGDGQRDRSTVVQVGRVALLDGASAATRRSLDDVLDVRRETDLAAALEQVRDGDVDAVVLEQGGRVVVRYSAADQVTAATVRGTFDAIVQNANVAATGQPPRFRLSTRQVEDDSLEPIQYFTPGLLGWAIATGAAFGAALSLVNWRVSGLLRRLRLAPIGAGSVVGARVGVSVTIALAQTAVFFLAAVLFFGLQLSGAWYMAVPLVVCAALAFMALGLLAGAIARTEEAASGIANIIVLPMAFLSGSFFPLDDAPEWIRAVSQAFPLRHLTDGLIDVTVRGDGPAAALGPMAFLLAFSAVVALIASRVFRWER